MHLKGSKICPRNPTRLATRRLLGQAPSVYSPFAYAGRGNDNFCVASAWYTRTSSGPRGGRRGRIGSVLLTVRPHDAGPQLHRVQVPARCRMVCIEGRIHTARRRHVSAICAYLHTVLFEPRPHGDHEDQQQTGTIHPQGGDGYGPHRFRQIDSVAMQPEPARV